MPKAVKNIVDISEGINSDASAKIISENSVADAVNVNIDRTGKIKSAIGFSTDGALVTNNYESGLYAFRTDDNSNTPAEYLLVQNGANIERRNVVTRALINSIPAPNPAGMVYANGSLFIYPKATGNAKVFRAGDYVNGHEINYDTFKAITGLWRNDEFQTGNATPDVAILISTTNPTVPPPDYPDPAFYEFVFTGETFSGGDLSLDYQNTNYALGSYSAESDSLAYMNLMRDAINNSLAPLTATSQIIGSEYRLKVESDLDGDAGNGLVTIYRNQFNIIFSGTLDAIAVPVDPEPDSGLFRALPKGKYSFSASYVMWDGSETNIQGTSCFTAFNGVEEASIKIEIKKTSEFNSFVKGIKVYLETENNEYSFLCEYKHDSTTRFRFYNENEFKTNGLISHDLDLILPLYSTFRFESGYDVEERTSPKMKKFIVVNNRGYAFNVAYGDDWHQDRIIISPQGKPFLLPEKNNIDIVTEDGDEYITAEHFGSSLYCFKKNTLFILNIGSNDPSSFFLSDSIFGVGVDNEAAVCKTEVGVFWANKNGIYYHNGEQLRNITFGKIEDEWKAIASDVIRCGYDIINKKVAIVRGDVTYSFDIRVGAFSKYNTIGTGSKSNFIVRDKKLSLIVGGDLKDFSDASGSVAWTVTTKDFDLGRRSVRKKIRRFYVTFEAQNVVLSNFTLSYALDNTGNFVALQNPTFINTDDNVNKNTVALFDLDRSITAYSVQLKIESTIQTPIKDISIVYRDKSPK